MATDTARTTKARTALSVVFLVDVSHLAACGASHLARVGVVPSVTAADRRAADAVAVRVTALRTLAARRQAVQRRHALSPETAPLLQTRVHRLRREDVARTGKSAELRPRHDEDGGDDERRRRTTAERHA